MKSFIPVILISILPILSVAQEQSSTQPRPYEDLAKKIITTGLGSGKAYEMLYDLSTNVGTRLSGSPQAARAVEWSKSKMEEFDFDNVWLEDVMVPHWVRGTVEKASVVGDAELGNKELTICALGGSIGTPNQGITAEVVQAKTFQELQSLGDKAKGKIIFFNRPMDRTKISTGEAYGGAVGQRGQGAVEAAKAGGVAALVRSMTTRLDDVPHTGAMNYNDQVQKVPAAAISTIDANFLDSLLSVRSSVTVNIKLSCETLPDVKSANVIGELRGTEHPEEVIVIGGHLDSWDKGQGAHDDGAGCIQSIEALRLLKELGLKPKRTIRAVMFMNEENGLRGGKAYAEKVRSDERHIAAIESDAGGFTPRGFGVSTDSATLSRFPDIVQRIAKWAYLFESIDADRIRAGGGGADISELAKKGVPTLGLRVDGHRYFDYHHSDNDTIDKVNERELELGAALLAILSYVLAQEGI
jgi:Zn-dependent M28 family amino/carboxypeptidase